MCATTDLLLTGNVGEEGLGNLIGINRILDDYSDIGAMVAVEVPSYPSRAKRAFPATISLTRTLVGVSCSTAGVAVGVATPPGVYFSQLNGRSVTWVTPTFIYAEGRLANGGSLVERKEGAR